MTKKKTNIGILACLSVVVAGFLLQGPLSFILIAVGFAALMVLVGWYRTGRPENYDPKRWLFHKIVVLIGVLVLVPLAIAGGHYLSKVPLVIAAPIGVALFVVGFVLLARKPNTTQRAMWWRGELPLWSYFRVVR